ncbi:MAG: RNA polymerase sigma factor [Thermoguttaceae bacterium]
MMSEQDLIERLLEETGPVLVLYARNWSPQTAEDVVQNAFLKLLREQPFPTNPKSWLFRVVRNACWDEKRREKYKWKQQEELTDWFEPAVSTPLSDEMDGEKLTTALESLDLDVRELIIARIWGDLTFREIAELTKRPISSLYDQYQRGLNRLKTILGENDEDE